MNIKTPFASLLSFCLMLLITACPAAQTQTPIPNIPNPTVNPPGFEMGVGCSATETNLDLSSGEFELMMVNTAVKRPIAMTHAGDGSGRLFINEKDGQLVIMVDGELLAEPFLDISGKISTNGERGLLGLAFHPNYTENGFFYVNYTDAGGDTVISRFSVSSNPDKADLASEQVLLTFEQPFSNHNGGSIAFGPDGYLYIATGDGGDGGDPQQNGQSLAEYLGKMLRIDIDSASPYAIPADNPWADSPDAVKEIWAYGLRNPWKFSFDRVTGDMYIGDVGQRLFEEISCQPHDSAGGENYGWRTMEGFSCFNEDNFGNPLESCDNADMTLPIITYGHSVGNSVTGGYVYRGSALPELYGQYIFGDLNGTIWRSVKTVSGQWQAAVLFETNMRLVSFGEDEAGELYIADLANNGNLYKLVQKD